MLKALRSFSGHLLLYGSVLFTFHANAQSFNDRQVNTIKQQVAALLTSYETYFNLAGDISEGREDRHQHFLPAFIELFRDGAYHYNDLDPTGTTRKDLPIKDYADNILLWYTQSGISCRMDKDRIVFGTTRRHQGNTWTIDAYAEKRLDGLYMGHTLNHRTLILGFRIAFNFQNNVLKDFIIAGVTVSSRDEMAKDVSPSVPQGTRGNRISTEQNHSGTFTDPRDSQTYKWVRIGEQVWMAENLAFKPENGRYWAFDNDQSNAPKYGYLYDWNMARQACPPGWHLPSDAEWTQLTNFVGSKSSTKLKAKSGWLGSEGTDDFGFSAIPSGRRDVVGVFYYLISYGYWWSATDHSSTHAWYRYINWQIFAVNVRRDQKNKANGFSVRCLKD